MSLDKSVVETLVDHEERIDELEQNGGGGGGTPGHVICNVTENDPPLEPVPQRKNLVFFSDAGKVEVQDFEELDATVVFIPEGGGGGGGTPSKLESPSGDAFLELKDGPATVLQYEWVDPTPGKDRITLIHAGMTSGVPRIALQSSDTEGADGTTGGITIEPGVTKVTGALVLGESNTEPNRVATRGYARSQVDAWSTKPATQNVDMNGHGLQGLIAPTQPSDAATKGYVDGIAGLAASIAEGELPLTRDTGNDVNVSAAAAGPLRFTRIGRTVTLSGLIQLTADSAGAATASFTGIAGAALPATNNTWRGIITDQSSGAVKNLNIMVYSGASGFRYTVVGAEAGASYRLSFVMVYRSAA